MQSADRSWRSLVRGEVVAGWTVLLGCTLGVAAGAAALPFYTAGVFVTPLQDAFGWSRSEMSMANMAWTLSVVLCAPFVGALIDRFGVRGPASVGLISLAATFFAYSQLNGQLWVYVVVQVLGAAAGVASTPVAFTRAINERFHHARGAALGLTLAGTGITAAFAPSLVSAVVQADGWRAGFQALALTALAATPLVFWLVGRRPDVSPRVEATPDAPAGPASVSAREALASATLRRLLAVFFVLALGVSGYVLHLIPMMTDAGLSVPAAAAIQGTLGVAVVAGRIAVGLLVDHFFAPRVAAVALSVTALGMLGLALGGTAVAAPAAFAIGFALGAEVDLIGYLTARYFGLKAYGRLYGLLYGAFVLGTGLSPLLIAALQASTGDYRLALYVTAGLVSLSVTLFAACPRFPVGPSSAR